MTMVMQKIETDRRVKVDSPKIQISLAGLVTTVLAGCMLGGIGSMITSQSTMAVLERTAQSHETRLTKIENSLESSSAANTKLWAEVIERLARIEGKLEP